MNKISGAEKLAELLEIYGVKVVFEYPGGAFAAVLDSIAKRNKIKLVVSRNDQAASLMADGYARASGEVGVCMATSGPGATNLITGVANAYMDSIPLVVVTGQVATDQLKRYFPTRQMGFQEIDIISIVENYKFKTSNTEQEFPKSFLDKEKISFILQKLNESLSPVIIAGGGVIAAKASSKLINFARMTGIPVATTLMGKGTYPEDDDLSLGMMGCHGARYTNLAVQNADLILALGTRFDIRAIGFGPPAAIGAYYARPEFNVINITGDGSFQMNIQELATIRRFSNMYLP